MNKGTVAELCEACQEGVYAEAVEERTASLLSRSVPKKGLSKEVVARAARDLMDRDGLEGFSLRGLATELGVHVTSLRLYYETKEYLLTAVFHLIHEELLHELDETSSWMQHLETSMRSFKQLLIRHPYLPLLSPYSVMEVALVHVEVELAALARAGFTPEEAALAFNTVRTFVVGAAIRERNAGRSNESRFKAQPPESMGALPHLRDASPYFQQWNQIFDFGLRGLLEFIGQEHQLNLARRGA